MGERVPALEWRDSMDCLIASAGPFNLEVWTRIEGHSWTVDVTKMANGSGPERDLSVAKLCAEGHALAVSADTIDTLRPSPHGVSVLERLAIGDALIEAVESGGCLTDCTRIAAYALDKATK